MTGDVLAAPEVGASVAGNHMNAAWTPGLLEWRTFCGAASGYGRERQAALVVIPRALQGRGEYRPATAYRI